jgi:hypothetical protein
MRMRPSLFLKTIRLIYHGSAGVARGAARGLPQMGAWCKAAEPLHHPPLAHPPSCRLNPPCACLPCFSLFSPKYFTKVRISAVAAMKMVRRVPATPLLSHSSCSVPPPPPPRCPPRHSLGLYRPHPNPQFQFHRRWVFVVQWRKNALQIPRCVQCRLLVHTLKLTRTPPRAPCTPCAPPAPPAPPCPQTSHAASGVEKGLASKTGLPIEIMGLITGHVDTEQEHTLVVMDVFPLPVEGTETTVLTDSDVVLSYMANLSDSLEKVRPRPPRGGGGLRTGLCACACALSPAWG